jgi:hypothetical protein
MKTHKRDRRGRFSLKSWVRRQVQAVVAFLQLVLRIAVLAGGGVAVLALVWGIYFSHGTITHADAMPAVATTTPVLERIAQCESHNSQFCTSALVAAHMCKATELGQVLHRVNTNGTIDTGAMQINSIHGAEAAKLGLNLDVEADNRAFARWIYENRGTGDWASSQKCWR